MSRSKVKGGEEQLTPRVFNDISRHVVFASTPTAAAVFTLMLILVLSVYLSSGGSMHCGQDCAVSARPEQPGVAHIYIVRQGHLPSGESINGGESRNTESPNETADPSTDGRRYCEFFDGLQVWSQ